MKRLLPAISTYLIILCLVSTSLADVTIKQRVTMSGQKFESTRRIKGSRERTEQRMEMADPAAAAYFPQIATITQCDLKRRIQINDRKQLYFIEPFETPEPEAAVRASRPAAQPTTGPTRKGGTMTISYNVRDTGERKLMFGLQARHLITTQEMESSADSCNGPNKTKFEYDGWYVDFAADFSCPSASSAAPYTPGRMPKPDCVDRFVIRGSGTAPRGMMLEGTMKIYGPDGSVQMSQTTETLELNRDMIDASVFDIPQGYAQASSSQDLFKISMPTFGGGDNNSRASRTNVNPMMPPAVAKSVSLNISGSGTNQADIDAYVRGKLAGRGLRVVNGTADYTVNINFRQIKESTAGKVGGIFGKVTGMPTGGAGKVDIDLMATLSGKASADAKVKDKFDGPLSAALRLALDQALDQLLENIGQ